MLPLLKQAGFDEGVGLPLNLLPLVDRVSSSLRTVLDVPSGRNALLFQNDWAVSNQFYDQTIKTDSNFVLA